MHGKVMPLKGKAGFSNRTGACGLFLVAIRGEIGQEFGCGREFQGSSSARHAGSSAHRGGKGGWPDRPPDFAGCVRAFRPDLVGLEAVSWPFRVRQPFKTRPKTA